MYPQQNLQTSKNSINNDILIIWNKSLGEQLEYQTFNPRSKIKIYSNDTIYFNQHLWL